MRNALLALSMVVAAGTAGASPTGHPQSPTASVKPAAATAAGGLGDGWSTQSNADDSDAASAAEGRRSVALMQHLSDLLAPSASPRDQAMRASLLRYRPMAASPSSQADEASAILRRAAAAGASDRLVQWMWANSTEAEAGCTAARPCPERDDALARIDPENAAAWLPMLGRAWADGDAAGTDAALLRMADATRYDDFFVEMSGAWVEVFGRFPEIASEQSRLASAAMGVEDADVIAMVSGMGMSAAFALPQLAAMTHACDRSKEPLAGALRFERCARIGRTMARQGTSMLSEMLGFAVVRRSGAWSPGDATAERAALWRRDQAIRALPSEKDTAGFRRYFSDLQSTGSEREAIQRVMVRQGIALAPPAGWDPSAKASAPGKE